MPGDEDTPVTVPPEIAAKDEEDRNVFERLLEFPKQVHVVTIRHAHLGDVKIHYAVLEAGEEPKIESKDAAKLSEKEARTNPNAFVEALLGSQTRKCWAMIEKAMRIDVCGNSCCHGPILPKYHITAEQWERLCTAYPDFVRFASGFVLGSMERDVRDFLPSLGSPASPS
jgi:hypothetical protein